MSTNFVDILSINESRLDYTSNGEINIPGYVIERKDRNRSGGGVALHFRNTINYKRLPHQEDDLEFLFIQVSKFKLRPFIVGTWNRPPWVCNRIYPKIRIHFERTGGLWAGG